MVAPTNTAARQWWSANSLKSAERVVPLVIRYVPARSVVDFGCKHGEWLRVFQTHGVDRILGIDQPIWANALIIESSQFCTADLNQALEPVGAFDLAVCVEVAEHLRKHAAPTLVDALTLAAPVVLFSAATPGQGGHGHLNERPRAFWHALFGARNFVPIDCLRPQIWQNKQVASWYRQNLFFYASPEGLRRYPQLAAQEAQECASDLDLVHIDVLRKRSPVYRLRRAAARALEALRR
jgi:hypothetical protein